MTLKSLTLATLFVVLTASASFAQTLTYDEYRAVMRVRAPLAPVAPLAPMAPVAPTVSNPYGFLYPTTVAVPVVPSVRRSGPPAIVAADGQFLGVLSTNTYDPLSVSNPYGRYGSVYSPTSITNPYSVYGSPYSPLSPTNPYAVTPARIR